MNIEDYKRLHEAMEIPSLYTTVPHVKRVIYYHYTAIRLGEKNYGTGIPPHCYLCFFAIGKEIQEAPTNLTN